MTKFLFFLAVTLTLAVDPLRATASLTLEAPSLSLGHTAGGLITKACEFSPHKDLCLKTLQSNPDSGHEDLIGLAVIALKKASSNATSIVAEISKMQKGKNPNLEPDMEQCLDDCLEHYLDAVDQLEDSLAALVARGFQDAKTWVEAAVADADACDKSFKDQGAKKLVLAQSNMVFRQLCNNGLAIVKNLA